MNRLSEIKTADFFLVPNLLSAFRVLLTIPLGYYLAINTQESILVCAILLIIAGLTDFLDGLMARLLNQKSLLGLYLDPLADKFMAIIIIIELIFTRSFPIWLAVAVIVRDILILIGGRYMKRRKNFMPFSFLTGKHYFSYLAVLCGSYIINFEFGIQMMMILSVGLMIASFYLYADRFYKMMKNIPIKTFHDKPIYKITRAIITAAICGVYLYRLYTDIIINQL